MKKLLAVVVAAFCYLLPNIVQATPSYYTFEGVITETQDADAAGGVGEIDLGLSIGDEVYYTFLIDFDTQGYLGFPEIVAVPNSYYVEFVDGTLLPRVNNHHYYENFGIGNIFEANPSPYQQGTVQINTTGFTIGSSALGLDTVVEWGHAHSDLTLVSITSVPEPSTLLLLGSGLLGLVGLNRRRKA